MADAHALFSRSFVTPDTYDAFFAVVTRLEQVIDSETRALSQGRHGQLADMTRQKRQGFLELNRIMRSLETAIPSQDIVARLDTFRQKLAKNSAMLATHLKAAQEVTGLIMQVMRDAESDGTYTSKLTSGHDLASGYDFA